VAKYGASRAGSQAAPPNHSPRDVAFVVVLDHGSNTSLMVDRMTQISLLRPEGLVQSPAFSHVAVVPPGATTVYVGGQNAVDGDGTLVGGNDVAAQTQQVMTNLHVALSAAGANVEDLVMMTILVVDGVDLVAAYPVAAAELGGAAPTVVVVRVAGLAVPGALVEVSAVAATTP
jgi:enamine deaminase RidA (YjgF/YER057c/UK114 family)